MGQILRNQIVGLLQRTSPSIVSLGPSVLNIGGQQYSTSTNLIMDITASGFAGLDTGSVAPSTTYHLYAVVNGGGVVGLVASLNLPLAGGPVGFSTSKYLWSIHTDQSSLILNFKRVGKKNVFIDTFDGVSDTPDVNANNPALVIDTSGGSAFPSGTSPSNNATFTNNMLSGLADKFEGVFFCVGDGGSTGFRAFLYETSSGHQGVIAAVGAFVSVVGVLWTAPYLGTVGASYGIQLASTLTERDLCNKILSYDNKLVDESSSAGTVVQNGTQVPGPRSEIFAQGGNGHGSTDTHIRRFANIVSVVGSDITVIDNATNGTYFRINSDGLYSIAYEDASSTGAAAGLTKNSPFLTTGVSDPTQDPYRLISSSVSGAGTDQPAAITTTLFLSTGDIIRAHNDSASTPDGTANNGTTFRITKVANAPGATSSGPRSEVTVWGANLVNTVAGTYITWWNNNNIVGADISYTSDNTNGDKFTINKDGVYSLTWSYLRYDSQIDFSIMKNQATFSQTAYPNNVMLTGTTSTVASGPIVTASCTFNASAGDIIRAISDQASTITNASAQSIRITKISD